MRLAEFSHESKRAFPRCKLHGTNIVNEFPDGCPFSAENTFHALGAIQDRGWALLGSRNSELQSQGLHILNIFDTCQVCMGEIRTHLVVQRLRRRAAERAA